MIVDQHRARPGTQTDVWRPGTARTRTDERESGGDEPGLSVK